MGLFKRVLAPEPKGVRAVELVGGQRVNAVGEAQYQARLEAICGGKCERGHEKEVRVFLVPEPGNPHDPDAVRVTVEGEPVGYLCRADAVAYKGPLAEIVKAKAVATCAGTIVGGWSRAGANEGNFGIWLDLAPPGACLPLG